MKHAKYGIQLAVGAILALLIMWERNIFGVHNAKQIVLIAGDAVTTIALLYLCVGFLIWVSATGFFDVFGYALKKGAHAILPGRFADDCGGYYEYKTEKQEKGRKCTEKSLFMVGVVFLIASMILTVLWFRLS